jgi:hypothetical protein
VSYPAGRPRRDGPGGVVHEAAGAGPDRACHTAETEARVWPEGTGSSGGGGAAGGRRYPGALPSCWTVAGRWARPACAAPLCRSIRKIRGGSRSSALRWTRACGVLAVELDKIVSLNEEQTTPLCVPPLLRVVLIGFIDTWYLDMLASETSRTRMESDLWTSTRCYLTGIHTYIHTHACIVRRLLAFIRTTVQGPKLYTYVHICLTHEVSLSFLSSFKCTN